MKRPIISALLLFSLMGQAGPAAAQESPPTVYTIVRGDTLWGLSRRFLNDPYYWPDLWAANRSIGNPHFIYPGQKIRVYADRIEVEEPKKASLPPAAAEDRSAQPAEEAQPAAGEASRESGFTVTGSEGFLMEKAIRPAGIIISTRIA